jgi:DNA replication protein DnaC
MIDQTLAQLHQLKLLGMAGALQRQLEQPACAELAFEQRLALLVQGECDSRQQRRCARLLQQARLKYPQAAIEDFDARPGRGIERSRLTGLALSDWASSACAVILTGATGCGKTWLACALGQYACRQGHSVRYLRVPRLAEELRTLRAAGSYTRWLAQLAKTEVLLLDSRPCKIHPSAPAVVRMVSFLTPSTVASANRSHASTQTRSAKRPFRPKRTIARSSQRML